MQRPVLIVTHDCNSRCLFCCQRGLGSQPPGPASFAERLQALREQGAVEVTLVGGEPGLEPALPDLVAAARRAGFRRVGLQTNAGTLADGREVERLARAGLGELHLSLHGAEAPVHDYHTGVPGSFGRVLAALGAARAHGLRTVVATVLTRSNAAVLGGLPPLLHGAGAAAWLVEVPRVAGALGETFHRVYPRLGLALPFAVHALASAARLGLPAWVRGAPLCMLGPYARRSLAEAGPRAFAPVCDRCAARPACPGLDPAYLARFHGDELAARGPAEPPDADPDGLVRLFAGPGALAPALAPEQVAARAPAGPRDGTDRPPPGDELGADADFGGHGPAGD